MQKKQERVKIHDARKSVPKYFKLAQTALANQEYQQVHQAWKSLQQAHLDSRELSSLNDHIKIFCASIRQHETKFGISLELHEFVDAFYRQLLQFLENINNMHIPLSQEKILVIESQPSKHEAVDRYCDYLVRAAKHFYKLQQYQHSTNCLLVTTIQLDEYIRLHLALTENKPNVTPAEVDIARMRQAIYLALCIRCRQLQDDNLDNTKLFNKAIAKYHLSNKETSDHQSYIDMKTTMQGTIWLLCTSELVDYDTQMGEYYQLKAKGLTIIWEKLLNGAPDSEFLNFVDIKNSAEKFRDSLEGIVNQNHLSGMLINSLKKSTLEFEQIILCLDLDSLDLNTLNNRFNKLRLTAEQQNCELFATTLALYHHRHAALAMQDYRFAGTVTALSLTENHTKAIQHNHYVQLRFWTSKAIAMTLDSDCDNLPSAIDQASILFGCLSATANHLDHLKTLYINYVSMLTAALQYFRSLEAITPDVEIKKKFLFQSIIIHEKIGLVRKRLAPEQLPEHDLLQAELARQLSQLTAAHPQQRSQIVESTSDSLPLASATDISSPEEILRQVNHYLTTHKPDAAHSLLITLIDNKSEHTPLILTDAYISLSYCERANSHSAKGIHLQQSHIKAALCACAKALAIATENNLLSQINAIAHFLYETEAQLNKTIVKLQLITQHFTSTLHKPLAEQEAYSLNHLFLESFAAHVTAFKKLINHCEKLKLSMDAHRYDFTAEHPEYRMPNYYLRWAKGVQVANPRKHVRSNSLDSFDGYIDNIIDTRNPRYN